MASGARAPDAFSDIEIPEGNQGQASVSAERLMELSLSSCPDNKSEDSDIEEGTSQRRFSCLMREKTSAGGSLLLRVQRHRQAATASSSTMVVEEDEATHIPHVEEQGKVFQ